MFGNDIRELVLKLVSLMMVLIPVMSDLAANYDAAAKYQGQMLIAGILCRTGSNSEHGTAVAGIIAAQGQNGTGVVGIAFNANLTGLPFRLRGITDSQMNSYMEAALQNFDVVNHSWGAVYPYSNTPSSSKCVNV